MHATKNSWKVRNEFPSEFMTLNLKLKLEANQIDVVMRGRIPHSMDNKWFIYFEDNFLYFHRSWTGTCIYKVMLIQHGYDWYIENVFVNADKRQYAFLNAEEELKVFYEIWNYFLDGII